MLSQIKTYTYPDGTIQRVQTVRPESWSRLDFLNLSYSEGALDRFADIYRLYLVPACPVLFGNLVMFRIPEDVNVPFSYETTEFGKVADRLTAAASALKNGMRIRFGKPVFRNAQVEKFWRELEERNSVRIVKGLLPVTTIIPVGSLPGYLTDVEQNAKLKVNSSFFIMDRFDCATVCDHIGTPLGLCVKDGKIINPPLFQREALLIHKDGSVSNKSPDVRELEMEINGQFFRNVPIYSRPERLRTPRCKGKKIVVIGCRVAAVSTKASITIPASGFVMCVEEDCDISPGDRVAFRGMEDVAFGIQVGNSIIRNGTATRKFISRFYNIRHLDPIPFPPSLYPMDFGKSRAARIALGADKEGNPILLWAEGAPKLGYEPGRDSRGATLADMVQFCTDCGMVNAVNLDGGGSAQILLNNRRSLCVSDRDPHDRSESERPIPQGLIIR